MTTNAIEPRPIDPDLLYQANDCLGRDVPGLLKSVIEALLADRAWHRMRLFVTEPVTHAAGISHDQIVAWAEDVPELHMVERVGLYVTTDRGEFLVVGAEDEIHSEAWRGVTGRRFLPATAETVNKIAWELGRAPLDVLDEISKTEVAR